MPKIAARRQACPNGVESGDVQPNASLRVSATEEHSKGDEEPGLTRSADVPIPEKIRTGSRRRGRSHRLEREGQQGSRVRGRTDRRRGRSGARWQTLLRRLRAPRWPATRRYRRGSCTESSLANSCAKQEGPYSDSSHEDLDERGVDGLVLAEAYDVGGDGGVRSKAGGLASQPWPRRRNPGKLTFPSSPAIMSEPMKLPIVTIPQLAA